MPKASVVDKAVKTAKWAGIMTRSRNGRDIRWRMMAGAGATEQWPAVAADAIGKLFL